MTGKVFGTLTVIKQSGNTKGGGAVWLCRCECGETTNSAGGDLRFGKSKCCAKCQLKKLHNSTRKHGQSNTRLYKIWRAMKTRCGNKNVRSYKNYGGRGIKISAEWVHDFTAFKLWADNNGYKKTLTIERKDVNKNYCPENCCWIPKEHQAFNKRNVPTTKNGKPWCHVAIENNIKASTYRCRVSDGWPAHIAATWPMNTKRPTGKKYLFHCP